MADLFEIVSYMDEYLDVASIKDYCPKGLQVEGKREVERIVCGVSACVELFEEAAKRGAQAALVHHGMFWDAEPRTVTGSRKKRLSFLLERDMSLLSYHLPLDCHPEVGNNIQLIKELGLVEPEPFGEYGGKTISYMAKTAEPVAVEDFIETVKGRINPGIRHYRFGAERISRVAVCSGAAPELVQQAARSEADVFITGEDAEWVYHFSKEEGIHYIAAGHHATERFGVIALGEKIKEKFGIDVQFVDVYNPI